MQANAKAIIFRLMLFLCLFMPSIHLISCKIKRINSSDSSSPVLTLTIQSKEMVDAFSETNRILIDIKDVNGKTVKQCSLVASKEDQICKTNELAIGDYTIDIDQSKLPNGYSYRYINGSSKMRIDKAQNVTIYFGRIQNGKLTFSLDSKALVGKFDPSKHEIHFELQNDKKDVVLVCKDLKPSESVQKCVSEDLSAGNYEMINFSKLPNGFELQYTSGTEHIHINGDTSVSAMFKDVDPKTLGAIKVAFSTKGLPPELNKLKPNLCVLLNNENPICQSIDLIANDNNLEFNNLKSGNYEIFANGLANPSIENGFYDSNPKKVLVEQRKTVNESMQYEKQNPYAIEFKFTNKRKVDHSPLLKFSNASKDSRYIYPESFSISLKGGDIISRKYYFINDTMMEVLNDYGVTIDDQYTNKLIVKKDIESHNIVFKAKVTQPTGWPIERVSYAAMTQSPEYLINNGEKYHQDISYKGDKAIVAISTYASYAGNPADAKCKNQFNDPYKPIDNCRKTPSIVYGIELLNKAAQRVYIPVINHYTIALSEPIWERKYIYDDINDDLQFHYMNLIADVHYLQKETSKINQNLVSTIVMNPDFLGTIRKCFAHYDKESTECNYDAKTPVFNNQENSVINNVADKLKQADNKLRAMQNYNDLKAVDNDINTTNFPSTLEGYVRAVNWIVKHYGKGKVIIGWQYNIWGGIGFDHRWIRGAARDKNNREKLIKNEVNSSKAFLDRLFKRSLDPKFYPDFLAIDKWERNEYKFPFGVSYYMYNAEDWHVYTSYVEQLGEAINLPIMLWQIPGGDLTGARASSEAGYYEASSGSSYFLGSTKFTGYSNLAISKIINKDINWKTTYYIEDPSYSIIKYIQCDVNNPDNLDCWKQNRAQNLLYRNIFAILWGGGDTTTITSCVDPNSALCDDDYLLNRIKDTLPKVN